MCGDRKVGKIGLTVAASLLTLALVALPVVPSLDGVSLDGMAAYAKGGNGGGNGGGNAGGKGGKGGRGGTGGASINLLTDSHGKGHTGQGNGHSKDAVSGVHLSHNGSHPENHGPLTSLLGRLNAAHASPTAMANAAGHSAVGLTAQYYDALAEALADGVLSAGEAATVAGLLGDLANKEVAEEDVGAVVQAYNELLNIETTVAPGTVTGGPGFNDYGGFEITGTTETTLIDAAKVEYGAGDVGGGLGPAP